MYKYREKIKIPYDKPYIILKGGGKRRTQIIWDDHDSLAQSPTFSSLADNIIVKGMTFIVRNLYFTHSELHVIWSNKSQ